MIAGIIANIIGGGLFGSIKDAYVAKLAAGNTQDRIVAEMVGKEAELQMREAEAAKAILVAEQGNWLTRSIRPLLGLSAAILTFKILVWDLALGQWTHGSTDMLTDQAYWLLTTIVVAYMGGRSIEKTASVIADAIKRR